LLLENGALAPEFQVNKLTDYGIIELEENGSAKRPVVWYDEIGADFPLTTASGRGSKANA
jgi:predicted transcriptional regulator